MKIAFLTPEYPHPKTGTAGGIGTSIKNLSNGLLQLGHQVIVLVYRQKEDAVFIENGITFYQIKNVQCKGISWWLTQKKIERLINSLFHQQKIDLVEAPDWTGITAMIQPKCPLVLKLHGSDTYFCYLDQRPVKSFNKFLEKRAFQKANAIISVSAYTANISQELFGSRNHISVIPNGVDVELFSKLSNITISEPAPIVLYFGTLIRKKGVLELPLIFNQLHQSHPKAQLWLVGKDSYDVQTKITSTWQLMQPLFSASARQQVVYKGATPYEQMQAIITQAAVCVFPTFAEALPVSWLEAMAMQKAIVASDIGWAKEVITDGKEGYLVHPKKHQEFALKILQLLDNKDLATNFGIQAKEKILQNYSSLQVAKRTIENYEKILQST
ncbi:MAG: glycosyltransferase family 4 protein [Flavobacterium sp.]